MMTDTILINTILPTTLIGIISIAFLCYLCVLRVAVAAMMTVFAQGGAQ